MNGNRLLYILPEYHDSISTHYAHNVELIGRLNSKLDVYLIVEKPNKEKQIDKINKIYFQKFSFPVFALIERLLVILFARAKGYKKAYIHYSYWGAIFSSLIFRLSGGEVFYWHCEVYKKYYSGFNFSIKSLRKKILDEYLLVLTLKLVNYLVTGSKSIGQFYQREFNLNPQKIKIIPNWINIKLI